MDLRHVVGAVRCFAGFDCEVGDKTQLVCMVLAARHGRARPVLLGATVAFALLNALAVVFGAALSTWIPQEYVLGAMAALFTGFGLHALFQGAEDEDEETSEISGHGLFLTAFLMIFLAELGDKTQFAVVGLAGLYPAPAVWIGATVALVLTSAAGIWAGKTVLKRLPLVWLQRLAGVLFLGLAALAVWRLLT